MARILIIEDNDDNRQLMTYLLSAFGHDVVTASDGEEGLRKLQDKALELVVCDVHLPKLDGNEIVARARAHPDWTSAPIIAVTALAMVGDRQRLLAAGFDGYISKPIDPQAFVEEIRAWLEDPDAAKKSRPPVMRCADPPIADTDTAERPAPSAYDARLLVVDDRQDNREMLRAILEPSGYDISLSASVEDAVATAAREEIDLVLCDLRMPGEDGLELLAKMKRDPRSRSIPFLMITAASWTPRERHRAFELGALLFLEQPIDPRALLEEIAARLAEAEDG